MAGQSPLNMMRSAPRQARQRAAAQRRARLWRFVILAIVIVALPIGWTMLWSYAASIAN
jgi:anti-sigma-K factor RskA